MARHQRVQVEIRCGAERYLTLLTRAKECQGFFNGGFIPSLEGYDFQNFRLPPGIAYFTFEDAGSATLFKLTHV